jgi:hypothetical protein
LKRLSTAVVALLCALAWPVPGDTQWRQVVVDGERVCEHPELGVLDPRYDGRSDVTKACNSFTDFEAWLNDILGMSIAEAQVYLRVPAPSPTDPSFNLDGFPDLSALSTGTPINHNVRQYFSGMGAEAFTFSVVHVAGDNAATEGWEISTDNLTHPGDNTGSGVFKLRATSGEVTVDSFNIEWSYTTPVTADWDWSESDGLHNGAASGGGDWAPFGTTLNADPNADNYLQLTHSATWAGWGGISSHHAQPAFIASDTYSCTVTIVGSGTHDEIWVQIGSGTAVEFAGTGAITHDVISGVGTQNIVLHGNGQAAEGSTTRISAASCSGAANRFNFASATYSVNETAGTLEVGVTRSQPTAAAASITVARTVGSASVLTVADTTLNWSASEGGTKFSTLNIVGDGQATVGISSPSVGSVGSIASSVITVTPEVVGGTDYPRIAAVWIGHNSAQGGQCGQYQSASGIEMMSKRHLVVMGRYPEMEAQGGCSSMDAIADAVAAASTVGTLMFNYADADAVYKDHITSAYATKRAKIANEGWYAYLNGSSGAIADSWFSSTAYTINPTSFAPPDTSGKRAIEWVLGYEWGWTALGTEGNTPAPGMTGQYLDNQNMAPRTAADWNRDGVTDSASQAPPFDIAPKTWYRAGMAAGVTAFRAEFGVPVLGNVELLATSNASVDMPEYVEVYDGSVLEFIVGLPDIAYESWLSTAALVSRLQTAEDMMIDPCTYGVIMSKPDDNSATNYQDMRHALAMTLVTTCMALSHSSDDGYHIYPDYEEYDYNLGQPTQTRRSAATSGSIWSRTFENGIVVWWPKDVTGTLNLGGTYCALTGEASAWLADGQSVTSVTAPSARNGIILSDCGAAAWDWVNPIDAANDEFYAVAA